MDAKLIFFIYRVLQCAASPFIVLYFVFRFLRDPHYLRRFPERLGFLPPSFRQHAPGAVWIHAVSVGEVLSAAELLRRLKAERKSVRLFVSTSTLAGRALAGERLAQTADGVFFAPLDTCFAVRRVLRTLRPSVVVVAETEIWPNLYREAKRAGCGLVVINGRVSDAAFPRYLVLKRFFRYVLRLPDLILAQSEVSRQRYVALGAPPESVADGGNLKYDFQPRQAPIAADVGELLAGLHPREIWIAASTTAPAGEGDIDEDDAVIGAFLSLAARHPGLLLILAPRKPERFGIVAEKLQSRGVGFVRRSALGRGERLPGLPGVLLLDSIGELAGLFSLGGVVFMGGSLASRGGHNILEPAFFSRAIVTGPHMENFPEIAASFRERGASLEIDGPEELAPAIERLLSEPGTCARLGRLAGELAESKRGATGRAVEEINALHAKALPSIRPPLGGYQSLWLLSRLWGAGSRWKQAWDHSRKERLTTPVVSVGGLTIGGSGKTPFVLWLTERLRQEGYAPGILTRGYRRRVPEKQTILEAGASVPVARTGDEAQIFLRSGAAPVGIGANRSAAGRALVERFHSDVLVLDDGFQHRRTHRDLDIVLLDALDPLGGGDLFPLGRLREPPEALARADVVVITRSEQGRRCAGIEELVRKHNPRAPVAYARVKAECWVDCESGERFPPSELPCSRLAAFCGLASPVSFWNTLGGLGYEILAKRSLADHHRYKPLEIRRLASEARVHGAEALLTTEKDFMNLCENAGRLVAPLRLFWLKIELELDEGERILQLVEQRLGLSRLKR